MAKARILQLIEDVSTTYSLPPETNRFIGRESELRKVIQNLKDPNCRLLTVLGVGGIGKTRLAIRAAAEILEETDHPFTDGIHFIPLAAEKSAKRLATVCADAMGVPLTGAGEPADQLAHYLRKKEMLLVLDNFEQLIEGAEQLVEWLREAPMIKLLVTSREALNLSEEWRFDLGGLPVPNSESEEDVHSKAVELFADRARRVATDFSLEVNSACVFEICRLVGGVPLAIELAASWVRSIPCAEIVKEIKTDLDFLEVNLRDVPDRHKSIRVVFDQSWAQLSKKEKQVYMALSLFPGGCSISAAKQVAGATPTVLSALVDKSMLQQNHAGRYFIHGLLRNFALEKLAADNQMQADAEDAFRAYFGQLAHNHQANWGSGEQLNTLQIFNAESANFMQAWEQCLQGAEIQRLDQMIFSLCEFFFWKGQLQDGVRLCQGLGKQLSSLKAETRAEWTRVETLAAKGLLWESILLVQLGNFSLASEKLEAAQARLNAIDVGTEGFLFVQGHIWAHGGRIGVLTGDYRSARKSLEKSRDIFIETNDAWGQAAVGYWQGLSEYLNGNLEGAADAYEHSRRLFSELGDERNTASSTEALAETFRWMERTDDVENLHLEAISAAEELNNPIRVGWMLHNLAWTYWHVGEFESGAETGLGCMATAEEISNTLLLAGGQACRAACLLHIGEFDEAQALAEAASVFSGKGAFWPLVIPLTLGEIALALKEHERAFELIEKSCEMILETRPSLGAHALPSLALAALSLGKLEKAQEVLKHALSLAMEYRTEIQARRALVAGAALSAARGDHPLAGRLYQISMGKPHFSNSVWYAEIAERFIDQDVVAESENASEKQSIWQAAENYLENL